MAKKNVAMTTVNKAKAEAKAARAAVTAMAKQSEKEAGLSQLVKRKYAAMAEKVQAQNSPTRAITTDVSAAVAAQAFTELTALGARALAEWSQRTAGGDGHFAKNVGYYSSLPQTVLGATVYIIELATRNPKAMTQSLGREITNKASNLIVNLGLSNTIRAVRYHLTKSIDEDQEDQAQKNALLNKIADLQKQLEAKK